MDTAKKLVIGTIAALAPVYSALLAMLALIGVDLVVGIWAEPTQWRKKLRSSAAKAPVYSLIIVLAYCVGYYLTGPSIPLLQGVAGVLGLSEFTSILAHLRDITGNSVLDVVLRNISARSDAPKSTDKP